MGSGPNQAARLCTVAKGGQILVSDRLLSKVEEIVEAECLGELSLKGFRSPVVAHNVVRLTRRELSRAP